MTPQERSIFIGGSAFILALLGAYLGLHAFLGSDSSNESAGQFIDNRSEAALTAKSEQVDVGVTLAPASAPAGPDTADTGTDAVPAPPRLPAADPAAGIQPAAVTTAVTASSTTVLATTPTIPTTVPVATSDDPASTTETTMGSSTTVVSGSNSVVPSPSSTTAGLPAPPAGGLNAVEREIHRLTNALRADPGGPLARKKPMPKCVGDGFYGINIDPVSGHPAPAPALTLNSDVSLELARPWSVDMDKRDTMSHRPSADAQGVYANLGINLSATGENVAWFSGYPDSLAAITHFEGWRESDTGHYCALVTPSFTHIGVGHHKGAAKSWATQNFYRLR